MGTANTISNSAALLKTVFDGGDPAWTARAESKLLAELTEDKTWGGSDSAQPIVCRYSMGAGVSADLNVAQSTATYSKAVAFATPGGRLYGVRYVDGEFIERTKGSDKAYVQGMKDAIKQGRLEYNSVWAQQIWSQGGGHVAIIPATATLTGATLTFSNPYIASLFEIDRQYQFASDDGTATSPAGVLDNGKALTCSAVDVEDCTVTFSANLNTVAGIAVSYYIHLSGNYGKSMDGILSWLPIVDTNLGTAFRGVTRSVAPNKLAGYRYDGNTGGRKSDSVRYGIAEASSHGVRIKRLYMNPSDVQVMVSEIQAFSTVPLGGEAAKIGHTGITFAGGGGVVVVEEPYCPKGYGIGIDPSDWRIWCGPSGMGHIQNYDSLTQRMSPTADSVEIRFAGYGVGVCPKGNGAGPGNALIV